MSYLVLREVTANNVNGETSVHFKGDVVSEHDLSDTIRAGIDSGQGWFRQSFEPLTKQDARKHRIKATSLEGPRMDGAVIVDAPWEDYVGLHPTEIMSRLADAPVALVEKVRAYERGGLARPEILDHTPPCEREPFIGYDELSVREVLVQLEAMPAEDVAEVITYEVGHRSRPAIVSFEPEMATV